MARPITPELVRGTIARSPGHIRWETIDDVLSAGAGSRTAAREAVDRMERDGEVNVLDIGECTIVKRTDAFEAPDDPSIADQYLTAAGHPCDGWVRRKQAREDRYAP